MIETLGWVRPGWVTTVSEFSLLCPRHDPIGFPHTRPKPTPETDDANDRILIRRIFMNNPKSDSAPYTLSEETRARLILMAAEEHITFAHAADVITDYYDSAMKSFGVGLEDLHSILALSKELKIREISVKSVNVTLALLAYLREHQLDVDDYKASVSLLTRLHQFGLTAQASEVTRILDVASELVTSGVPPSEVEQWLAQRPKGSRQ